MGTLLESYLSFLPTKHQELIEDTRAGAVEPFSILSVIHWVAHSEMIPDKLSRLIIKEGQQILGKINPNNYSWIYSYYDICKSKNPFLSCSNDNANFCNFAYWNNFRI